MLSLDFQPEGQPFNLILPSEIKGERRVWVRGREKLTNRNLGKGKANLIDLDSFNFNRNLVTAYLSPPSKILAYRQTV